MIWMEVFLNGSLRENLRQSINCPNFQKTTKTSSQGVFVVLKWSRRLSNFLEEII